MPFVCCPLPCAGGNREDGPLRESVTRDGAPGLKGCLGLALANFWNSHRYGIQQSSLGCNQLSKFRSLDSWSSLWFKQRLWTCAGQHLAMVWQKRVHCAAFAPEFGSGHLLPLILPLPAVQPKSLCVFPPLPMSPDPDLSEPAQQPAAPQRVHQGCHAQVPVPHQGALQHCEAL